MQDRKDRRSQAGHCGQRQADRVSPRPDRRSQRESQSRRVTEITRKKPPRMPEDNESCRADVTSTHWAAASPSAGRICSRACRHCCRSARAWNIRLLSAMLGPQPDAYWAACRMPLPGRAGGADGAGHDEGTAPIAQWPRPSMGGGSARLSDVPDVRSWRAA